MILGGPFCTERQYAFWTAWNETLVRLSTAFLPNDILLCSVLINFGDLLKHVRMRKGFVIDDIGFADHA